MNNPTRVNVLTLTPGNWRTIFFISEASIRVSISQVFFLPVSTHDFLWLSGRGQENQDKWEKMALTIFHILHSRLFACVWLHFTTIWVSATDSLDHMASSGKYSDGQKNYCTNYNTFPRYFLSICGVPSPKGSRGFKKWIQFNFFPNGELNTLSISRT